MDNEPGCELLHNHGVFQRFVDHLRDKYGDVETLNREWGLVYWSHRLSTWADLWTPDGNAQPQYDVAWRGFQARQTTEFIGWQADIVREYARPEQFVTTCISYTRPAVEDDELTDRLDIASGNPYYGMQDGLALARPDTGRPRAEVEDHRRVGAVPDRRPDVLLTPGAVPGHRDQRQHHRHDLGQPARATTASGGRPPGRWWRAAPG